MSKKICMGCMEWYEEKYNICPYCGYEENSLPEEAFHLTPGTVLGERYQVGKVLGFGGFGVTYIGYDMELEKKVAIKEYLPSEFATRTLHQTKLTVYGGEKTEQFEQGVNKFCEEATKLAKFSVDSEIVNVYDSFSENNTAYIIMEYLEGESLKELLNRKGKLSLEETEQIILPIFRSLNPVHEAGIIHRDIAPDNIFITKDGKVKLLDFGAARYASATHSRSLTVMYKEGYTPVEQYQSRGEQGPWTDVYALAATMYKCMTGIVPDNSLERKVKDTLKKPSKMGIEIPVNKETALLNALNIEIKSRTKSTEAFLAEWESKGVVERIHEKFEKMDAGKLSKKAKTGIIAAVFGVVALLTIVIGISGSQTITDTIKLAQGMSRVPSIVNEDVMDAQTIAAESSIRIEQENVEYSSEIPKDKILTQSYSAGSIIESSVPLKFVVSGGVRQIYVPEMIGLSLDAAKELLEKAGFGVVEEVEEYSTYTPKTIIRTSLAEASNYDEGTPITIYVSKGIDPATQEKVVTYEVPDVVGMTEKELLTVMEEYVGIYVDSSEKKYTGKDDKGKIIAQKTKEGTVLFSDDENNNTLYVTVSLGIEMVRVPQLVIGKQYDDVVNELKALGFTIGTKVEQNDATMGKGLVISLSTNGGMNVKGSDELPKGSTIDFVVSKGTEAENHIHNYGESIVKDATCTEAGQKKGVCASCGDEYVTTIPAKGHKEEKVAEIAATCTAGGKTEGKRCTVCGTVTVSPQDVPAKGHQEKTLSVVVATCTAAGKTEGKQCSVCGTTTVAQQTVAAKGHSEVKISAVAATCTATGLTEGKKCSVCGTITKAQQATSMIAHSYSSDNDIDCNACGYARGYWSEWSDWQDGTGNASSTTEVENRTLYQSRTKNYTQSSTSSVDGWTYESTNVTYGGWSEWSTNAVSASKTDSYEVVVETRQNSYVQSVYDYTQYHYHRYSYCHKNNGLWYVNNDYTYANNNKKPGTSVTEEHKYITENKGSEFYEGSQRWWYVDKQDIYKDETVYYTEYRSRTDNFTHSLYQWSAWGDWSTTPVSATGTTEVNTKNQYRTRRIIWK